MQNNLVSLLVILCNLGLCPTHTTSYYEMDYSYDSVNIRFVDCWGKCEDFESGHWRGGDDPSQSIPKNSVLISRLVYVFETQKVYFISTSGSQIYICVQPSEFFSEEQNMTMDFEDKKLYMHSILEDLAGQAIGIVEGSYGIRCEPESDYQYLQEKYKNSSKDGYQFMSNSN